jgi:hypothetical protein
MLFSRKWEPNLDVAKLVLDPALARMTIKSQKILLLISLCLDLSGRSWTGFINIRSTIFQKL